MKRVSFYLLVGILVTLSGRAFSQGSSLVLFSANGEKFKLEVNGTIQNQEPLSRVEVTSLWGPSIKVKVYPVNPRLPVLAKSIFNSPNAKLFYVYKMDSRGKYFLGKTTYEWSVKSETSQSTSQSSTSSGNPAVSSQQSSKTSPQSTTGNQQSTTTRSQPTTSNQQSTDTRSQPTTSNQQSTNTRSQPSTSSQQSQGTGQQTSGTGTQPAGTGQQPATRADDSRSPEPSEKHGCVNPVPEDEFQSSLSAISRHPFDGPRLQSAKSLARNSCLLAEQVRDILYLFDNEATRLDFAKYAYLSTYDPKNYKLVRDVLNPASGEMLDAYIRSLPK
jgi:hypothetical protein